jgi:hypothetical protein
LKSAIEWQKYCQSGKKPADIPYNPRVVYLQSGWSGYGDWLGTGSIGSWNHKFQPFKKARAFARGLKLNPGANGTNLSVRKAADGHTV